jgi:hypothetical protein
MIMSREKEQKLSQGKNQPKVEKSFLQKRGDELWYFFKFLDSDPAKMGVKELLNWIYDYAQFRFEDVGTLPVLSFANLYSTLAGGLLSPGPEEHLEPKRQFFSELRRHLRSRVETIIDAADSKSKDVLFALEGALEVGIRAGGQDFRIDFVAADSHPDAELDLEREKRTADEKFIRIVRELGLRPDRFGRCARCGNLFYQDTAKKRNYCSRRCAGALRQRRYIKRINEQKGGEVQV